MSVSKNFMGIYMNLGLPLHFPGLFSFFNVRRLMNILYSNHDSLSNVAILSLDAEKAFD